MPNISLKVSCLFWQEKILYEGYIRVIWSQDWTYKLLLKLYIIQQVKIFRCSKGIFFCSFETRVILIRISAKVYEVEWSTAVWLPFLFSRLEGWEYKKFFEKIVSPSFQNFYNRKFKILKKFFFFDTASPEWLPLLRYFGNVDLNLYFFLFGDDRWKAAVPTLTRPWQGIWLYSTFCRIVACFFDTVFALTLWSG